MPRQQSGKRLGRTIFLHPDGWKRHQNGSIHIASEHSDEFDNFHPFLSRLRVPYELRSYSPPEPQSDISSRQVTMDAFLGPDVRFLFVRSNSPLTAKLMGSSRLGYESLGSL